MHVDAEAPVKFFMLRLQNDSGRARKLSVTGYVEWVLGDLAREDRDACRHRARWHRRAARAQCVQHRVPGSGRVLRRRQSAAHAERRPHRVHRPQLLAAPTGRDVAPDAERTPRRGDGSVRRDPDSGRARRRRIARFHLPARRRPDRQDATTLVERFRRNGSARASFEAIQQRWKRLLGAISVRSPDPTFDVLANGWLLYQVISCRLWARSGFYQSGGAFGFRDQLQDAMSLVHADASLLREQIVLSASRQFVEGDVQHWWHPPAGRGVRTQCSDDFLWLPLATARYRRPRPAMTRVLDERIGFLEGRLLNQGEESYYDMPLRSAQSGDLYEHCRRAIEHGFRIRRARPAADRQRRLERRHEQRRAPGPRRKRLARLLLLCSARPSSSRSRGAAATSTFATTLPRTRRRRCSDALEKNGWDGDWYLRAYFDDGTPLGSAQQSRMPHRRDRAELVETLRRRRSPSASNARSTRSTASSSTRTAN